MTHNLTRGIVATMAAALLVTFSMAQDKGQPPPQMTPEQQAEMEAWMKAGTPGPQHKAMAAEAGSYTTVVKSWPEPGAPATEEPGTAKRSITNGGRVLVEDFACSMMGMPFTGQGMRGYDNVSGKYWSTWTDSMSTGMMFSQGTCDDAKKTCTFTGTYNDPLKKGPVTSRMVSRVTGPNTEMFEMYGPDKKGKEFKMMEITYTKK